MSMFNGNGHTGWPRNGPFKRNGVLREIAGPPRVGPFAFALQARLEQAHRTLEFQREILDARLRALTAMQRRLGDDTLTADSIDEECPPELGEGDPTTRRNALHRIFARIPQWQVAGDGFPSLGYVNAILEFEGFRPLESAAKLQAEFVRWRSARRGEFQRYPDGSPI